jgi:2-oxo-4-hydroxy-4-carboxy-5-ureidoimidazoline decarboxylase
MNKVLARWNSLDLATATRAVLPCCGSQAWATALASARPIEDEESLIARSSSIWLSLPKDAWQEALYAGRHRSSAQRSRKMKPLN